MSFMVGLRYWNMLGDTLMIETGTAHNMIAKRATTSSGGFSLTTDDDYQLNLASMTASLGGLPGIYRAHNGRDFTTTDADHDTYGSNCAHLYNSAPWWYTDCWSGSIWGGCGGSGYSNAPYWEGSGSDHHDHGAIWVRAS